MYTCIHVQSANAAVRGVSALTVTGSAANFSGKPPIFSGKVPVFSGSFAGRVGAAYVRYSNGANSRPVSARSYIGGGARTSGPAVGGCVPVREEEKQ
jgi:hypothetical protein